MKSHLPIPSASVPVSTETGTDRANRFLSRLDRRPPARCDPDHGWSQGAGKCVRSKRKKSPSISKRSVAAGLVLAGAGTLGLAVAAGYHVKKDLQRSSVPFDSIRQPPGGIPDEQTYAKYDTFQPGDLIRKNFKSSTMGNRQHYAVYIGKDPETGEHMCIDTGEDWKDRDNVPTVLKRGLTWIGENPENDSEWEVVPQKDMGLVKGTRKFSREEIVKRAESMLYSHFQYQGFKSNCESFARGIVEGKAYSQQGLGHSPITNFIANNLTDNVLRLRTRPPIGGAKESAFGTDKEITKLRIPNMGLSGENVDFLEVTGRSNYEKNRDKMTAQQMVDFLRQQEIVEKRREGWDWIPNPYTGKIENRQVQKLRQVGIPVPDSRQEIELILQGDRYRERKAMYDKTIARRNRKKSKKRQGGGDRKDSAIDEYISLLVESVGMKSPDLYWDELIARAAPASKGNLYEEILVKGVRSYLEVFFGVFQLKNEKRDSLTRLDRRPPAKCDPKSGWRRGALGKCVRTKRAEITSPRKGEVAVAALGKYEIDPETGRPYKIRDLRVLAREKGVVGYGSMTTSQMQSAMRLIDENPTEAQKRNLVKTLSRDRSYSGRAIGAGLGSLRGGSKAEKDLYKDARSAAQTWKRLEAVLAFAGAAPVKWGVLAAGATVAGVGIGVWEKMKSDYRNGLPESAKIAAERAKRMNVRPPTPSNPSGQYLRRAASEDGKRTGSENITFVVGGGRNQGSQAMIDELRRAGEGKDASEGDKWLSRNNFVAFDLRESGSRKQEQLGGIDESVEMMGDFYRNHRRGRNQDAVDLASSVLAYSLAYPDKRISLVAHGAGGLATKEAMEIISKAEIRRAGKKTIKGVDLVQKINVTMLGTPDFGYTKTVAPNTRTIVSSQDPISKIPFFGGAKRPQWISSVKGHSSRSYLRDPSVREALRESFGYYQSNP